MSENFGSGLAIHLFDAREQSAHGRVVNAQMVGDLTHGDLPEMGADA